MLVDVSFFPSVFISAIVRRLSADIWSRNIHRFSVYIGTAIYTPSIPGIMKEFGVSEVVAILGLSLFIEGYALGPLVCRLLAFIVVPSRSNHSIYSFILPDILPPPRITLIGTKPRVYRYASHFRHSAGPNRAREKYRWPPRPSILGWIFRQSGSRDRRGYYWRYVSLTLPIGTASPTTTLLNQHIYRMSPQYIQYTIGLWALAAVAGPVLGPIAGGFAAVSESWRWPLWEILWISGFATIFFALLLPETLPGAILLKRAQRLRKLTGNESLRSKSEIDQAHLSASAIAWEALVRPFELMLEPAILFCNLYIGRKCSRLPSCARYAQW